MVSFVAYTDPNRSRVGAIDNPGLFEQVFDLKKFYGRLFDALSSESTHFWCFIGLYKQFYLLKETYGNYAEEVCYSIFH
eukprot:UN20880